MELTTQNFNDLWNVAKAIEMKEDGLSQNEIAEKMQLSRGEVCKLLNRADQIENGTDEDLEMLFLILRSKVGFINFLQKQNITYRNDR